MNTSIRFLLVAAGTSLLAGPALRAEDAAAPATPSPAAIQSAPAAQPAGSRFKEMRERRLQQLDEKLHLTPEQKARIQEIWDKAEAEGKTLHEEQTAANRERRAKRRDIMRTTHQEVRGVLTPEQQKLFDAMPRRPHRSGPAAGDAEGR
jgi:Spy/CpxP family protein refolding chaperone